MFAVLGVRVTLIEKRDRLLEFADREIVELTPKLMVMRFVDPEKFSRYGTSVYVKC